MVAGSLIKVCPSSSKRKLVPLDCGLYTAFISLKNVLFMDNTTGQSNHSELPVVLIFHPMN